MWDSSKWMIVGKIKGREEFYVGKWKGIEKGLKNGGVIFNVYVFLLNSYV